MSSCNCRGEHSEGEHYGVRILGGRLENDPSDEAKIIINPYVHKPGDSNEEMFVTFTTEKARELAASLMEVCQVVDEHNGVLRQ